MKNYNLTAKTFAGLEPVLAKEIKQIGGKNIKQGRRAVHFEGNLKLLYKSNYFLRSALRILQEIKVFHFKNVDQFYLRCKQVEWLKHMSIDQSFMINSSVFLSDDFKNSMFTSLKVKDAIADYFRDKTGKRPNVDTQNPEIYINVHIHQNKCTLSLDSSGESLHKRGYRVVQGQAPLNEVLAAGMIMITGWKGQSDFVDPMCGSGTLPIEAAMIAQDIPAGKFRKNYAFFNWNNYNSELFEEVKSETEKKSFTNKIYASDISAENVLNAKTNARRALVYNKIEFQISDIKDLNIEVNNATIVVNPPYGERLKSLNLDELYSLIGERLKHQFPGNSAWILSSSKNSLKHIGLKPQKKMELYNGALQCRFMNFPLFTGKLSGNNS